MPESCCCSTPQGSNLLPLGDFKESHGEAPGLYKIGKPDESSPVLVTSNLKMTFDLVRSQLDSINAWILVLNTYGINVWCAANALTVRAGVCCAEAIIRGKLKATEPVCGCSQGEWA